MNLEINEEVWYQLESKVPQFGALNARRIQADINMLIGIDHDGYRHILLELEDLNQAIRDNRSRGLSVQGRLLIVEDMPERPFLDVVCTDKDGHKVFNMVTTDILHKLAAGLKPSEAVIVTLNRWRKFWGGVSKQALSDEEVKGLFGELWFLLLWLLPKGLSHVEKWVGPTGARHDFEWTASAIEVKTTTSLRGHIHRIHGLEQLDPPESGALYLYSLRLRQEGTSSNTLPLLVHKITELLKPEPALLELFESRLAQAGYSPVHNDQYSDYRFRVIDERVYVVNNLFPRLTLDYFKDGLPHGVERIDYDINLEGCHDYILFTNPYNFDIDLD